MAQFRGIDLLPSHRAGPLEELGTVEETLADNDTFRVAGRLDGTNPEARRLFEKVAAGRPYQLSVGGRVLKAFWADDDDFGKRIKHIDDVTLDHIALCRPGQAANPDTYLHVMAKSAGDGEVLGDPPGREGLALRIGRALLEALWPFAKAAREEPPPEPDAERERAPAAASVGDLARIESALQKHVDDVRATAERLRQRLETLESARGVPTGVPGQEAPRAQSYGPGNRSLWKGVL
jgi:hypothetical protein